MLGQVVVFLRTWIIDHWYGRLSLVQSFWINMVFVNLGAGIVFRRVTFSGAAGFVVGLASIALSVWQLVGLWRAAKRCQGTQPIWSVVLMGICILNVVFVLGLFMAVLFGGQDVLEGLRGIDERGWGG